MCYNVRIPGAFVPQKPGGWLLVTENALRERLSQVRCFMLDMDGTFYLGDRLLEGSLDFLDALERTAGALCL